MDPAHADLLCQAALTDARSEACRSELSSQRLEQVSTVVFTSLHASFRCWHAVPTRGPITESRPFESLWHSKPSLLTL